MKEITYLLLVVYIFFLVFVYTNISKESFIPTDGERVLMSFKLATAVNKMPYYIGISSDTVCGKLNDGPCIDKLILTTNEDDAATFDLVEDYIMVKNSNSDSEATDCHSCVSGTKYLKIKDKYLTKCCEKHLCMYSNKKNAIRSCIIINITNSISIRDIDDCSHIAICKDKDKEKELIGEECIEMCLSLQQDRMAQFLILDKKIY